MFLAASFSSTDQRTANGPKAPSPPVSPLRQITRPADGEEFLPISAEKFAASTSARSSVNTQRAATAPSPIAQYVPVDSVALGNRSKSIEIG
jgi:hypothetical protein